MKHFILFVLMHLALSISAQSPFIKLQGGKFIKPDGSEFFQIAVNYKVSLEKTYSCQNSSPSDPITYFGPAPHGWCDMSRCMNWGTPGDCETLLIDDLETIQDMGFNTIRILPAQIGFTCDKVPYAQYDWEQCWSLANSTNMTNHINAVTHLLDVIETNAPDLKVVVLTGASNCFLDANTMTFYNNYLGTLANALKDYTCIIAYDLFNEPSDGDGHRCDPNIQLTKHEVCLAVNNWYNIVKANDPNHLTTIGLHGPALTAWDMSIMQVDFISFHLYPWRRFLNISGPTPPDNDPYWSDPPIFLETAQMAMNRAYREIKWISEVCPLPWIIGETGFSAMSEDPGIIYPMCDGVMDPDDDWGTEQDQSDYAETSLNMVRNCGGIGYSWWRFQDERGRNERPYATTDPARYDEDYFGLITVNDQGRKEKTAGDIFRTFAQNIPSPSTCNYPSNYYFPYEIPTTYVASGIVETTITNVPIPNAIVAIQTGSGEKTWTVTDGLGTFALYSNGPITQLRISAIGTNSIIVSPGLYPITYELNPSTHYLKDLVESNKTFNSTDYGTIQGWNTVNLTNITYNTNSSGTIRAGNWIKLNPSFHAVSSCTLNLTLGTVWQDCYRYPDEYYQPRLSNPENSGNVTPNPTTSSVSGKGFTISPNPSSGLFTIQFKSGNGESVSLMVLDVLGKIIYEKKDFVPDPEMQLDLTNYPKGIYMVQILMKNGEREIKKVVIQ